MGETEVTAVRFRRPLEELGVQLLEPGVWVVMHCSALRFPGVVKDYERGRFVKPVEDPATTAV